MSDNVSTNLQALIDFRNDLTAFNRELADRFAYIHARWRATGDAWQDGKYEEFGQTLEEVNEGIRRYLAATDDHEAHLLRLIETLRAFLDTRLG